MIIAPYKGQVRVSSKQGMRSLNGGKSKMHNGIDLYSLSSSTAPLFATCNGKVYTSYQKNGLGNYVKITETSTGRQFFYGHMSKVTVRSGQMIEMGMQIGNQGSTGNSTGPHCHYEIRNPQNVAISNSSISGIPNEKGTTFISELDKVANISYSSGIANPSVPGSDSSYLPPVWEPLYDTVTTRKDAIVREVGYLNKGLQPSILPSDIKLSCINYTTLLNSIFSSLGNSVLGDNSYSANLDKLSSVQREIIQFFIDKGMNASVGVGIAANVQAECSFNIASESIDSNGLYSSGICQWNGPNRSRMVKVVPDWKTNLTGQLNFLWNDLNISNETYQSSYYDRRFRKLYGVSGTFIEGLKSINNTDAGAMRAADLFVRVYENPANQSAQSKKRQQFAVDIWKKVVIQQI